MKRLAMSPLLILFVGVLFCSFCESTPLTSSLTTEATFLVEDAVFNDSFIGSGATASFGTRRFVRKHVIALVDGIIYSLDKTTLELIDYFTIGYTTGDEIVDFAYYKPYPSLEEHGVIVTLDYRIQDFSLDENGMFQITQAIWEPDFDEEGLYVYLYPITSCGECYIETNGLLYFFLKRNDGLTKTYGFDTQFRYHPNTLFSVDPRQYEPPSTVTYYSSTLAFKTMIGRNNQTFFPQYKTGSSFSHVSTCGNANCTYDCYWDTELPFTEHNFLTCGGGYSGMKSAGFGLSTAVQMLEQPLPDETYSTVQTTLFNVIQEVDYDNPSTNFSMLAEIVMPPLDDGSHEYEMAHLSAGVADDQGRYYVVGDDMGYIHAAALHELPDKIYQEKYLNSWRVIDNIPAGKTAANYSVKNLLYDAETMSFYALANTWIYRIAIPDCAALYSSWKSCVEEGGLRNFCYFDVPTFSCKNNVNNESISYPPTITGASSLEIHGYGETVEIYGSFDFTGTTYECRFKRKIGGEILSIVNGTVYNSSKLACVGPSLPEEHVDITVTVDITLHGNSASTNSIDLTLYTCYTTDRATCFNSLRAACGYCFSQVSSCTAESHCDVGQWLQTTADYLYVQSITPPSGGSEDPASNETTNVVLSISGYSRMSNTTYSYFACLVYSEIAPDTLLYSLPADYIGYNSIADVASFNCSVPVAISTSRLIALQIDELRVTSNAGSFGFYDCTGAACAGCVSESRPDCKWCPVTSTCSVKSCPYKVENDESCPKITGLDPVYATRTGGDELTIFSSIIFSSSLFECKFTAANETVLSIVPATYNGSYPDGAVIQCVTPEFPQGDINAKVMLLHDGTEFAPLSTFPLLDCTMFNGSCSACMALGKGACGYCVPLRMCTGTVGCSANFSSPAAEGKQTFLRDCPRILSSNPIEGAESGNTSISVIGPEFVPGEPYECVFGDTEVVNGTLDENATSLSCYTPAHSKGFVELEIANGGVVLTQNTISFVYDDCSIGGYSCNECIKQRVADCGWCLSIGSCSGRSSCPHDAFFADNCPTALLSIPTADNRGGMPVWVSLLEDDGLAVSYLSELVNMTWQCVWKLGEYNDTVNATVVGDAQILCGTGRFPVDGTAGLSILVNGVDVLKKETPFIVVLEKEYDYVGWLHPLTVAWIALISHFVSFIIVFIIAFLTAIGFFTPVSRVSSRIAMIVQFGGALLLPLACMLWITTPGDFHCNIRVFPMALAATMLFMPTSAKMAYLFYQAVRSKSQRNKEGRELVYRIPHLFVLLYILIPIFLVTFVAIVWVVFNPMHAQINERFFGDTTHTVCYSTFHYVFEVITAIIPLLPLCVTSVTSFITLNQITPWQEAKFLFITQLNMLCMSVIFFVLTFFAFEFTRDWAGVLIIALGVFFVDVIPILIIYLPKVFVILFRRKSMDDMKDYITELEYARRKKLKAARVASEGSTVDISTVVDDNTVHESFDESDDLKVPEKITDDFDEDNAVHESFDDTLELEVPEKVNDEDDSSGDGPEDDQEDLPEEQVVEVT